jgi:amino acid permease
MDPDKKTKSMDEFSRKEKKVLMITIGIFALIVLTWLILQMVLPENTKREVVNVFENLSHK